MKAIIFFITALLIAHSNTAKATAINVLVPAYANPCCADGPDMWSNLIETAMDLNKYFDLHAIFNPASGPGNSRDANYLNDIDQGPLNNFNLAGGTSHGYVATTFGFRPIEEVKTDIEKYLSGHYSGFVEGIFFDEMSNDLANVGYYQELHAYVQSIMPGARTFGNPGTSFVNNPNGQTLYSAIDYVNTFDTVINYENLGNVYTAGYTEFDYMKGLSGGKFGHILHTQALWDKEILTLAEERNVGFLYVTDDPFAPDFNPYDTLSSYWNTFTQDVSAFNRSIAVSAPSVIIFWLFGCYLLKSKMRLTTSQTT